MKTTDFPVIALPPHKVSFVVVVLAVAKFRLHIASFLQAIVSIY